jgi:O-antigen ligase
MGVADGGLFPRSWRLGTLAFLAVAAAALLARERVRVRRLEWGSLAALAAYAAWITLSAEWGGNRSDGERALLYVAAVLTVLVLADRASLPHLLAGTLAGITAASAYGLAIYLFTDPPLDTFEGALLYQPLGYANALGIFVGIGVLLAAGLALVARGWPERIAALAPLSILVPALLLTSSRGAWMAVVAGSASLALFRGPVRKGVFALVGLVAAGFVAAAIAVTGDVGQLVSENRLRYWEIAWADFLDHPWVGSGSGTFGNYLLTHDPTAPFSRTAHSLYLQSLAELGPLGLILVVAALAGPLAALAISRRRDPLVATAAAGYTAYVIHAGIDWDWEIPAVTLAGLFCGAALLVTTRARATALTGSMRLVLAGAVMAFAVFAAIRA